MTFIPLTRLTAVAAAAALPVAGLVASPAEAAAINVVCVGAPVGVTCDSTVSTIAAAAIGLATNGLDDLIAVGPGTYDEAVSLNGGTGKLTLRGSGDSTVITLPAGAPTTTHVNAVKADVENLKVSMGTGTGHWGVNVSVSGVRNVTIDGQTATNGIGILAENASLDDVRVQMPTNTGRGIYLIGDAEVSDAVVTAGTGVAVQDTGLQHVTRARITTGGIGINVGEGDLTVDNSLIDLGSANATGLRAGNTNPGTGAAFITADHVTVVGGGGNSRGVQSLANTPTAKRSATVLLSNSVIHGPATPIQADATNDGNQGGSSEAFVGVSYTDYDDETAVETIGANGTGGVSEGAGNLDVDPGFLNVITGNYRPGPGSPLIDAGNPAASTSTLDLDGNPRVADGNGDITAVRDLGAYEVPDTFAPQTVITGATASPTRDRTPTVKFTSEPGATFTCKVDAKPAVPCASPFTAPSLTNGTHKIAVTARDSAGNADPTPATRTIVVDTVAPNTRFLSKSPTVTSKAKVRFTFTASGAVRYQCRLDARAWQACTSPRVVSVTRGRHTFAVRGIDRAGNIDPTPARYTFRRS
ncbi:MAG: hypothetical protein EOO67_08515 [Microbacterium sp.]|nr:MAG: hypothetical protein EOO67_08515 [Microbacterium sp.]